MVRHHCTQITNPSCPDITVFIVIGSIIMSVKE
jgi:hypothetical protein